MVLQAWEEERSEKVVQLWTGNGQKTLKERNVLLLNGLYFIAAVLLSWSMWVDFSKHIAGHVQRLPRCVQRLPRRWALGDLPQWLGLLEHWRKAVGWGQARQGLFSCGMTPIHCTGPNLCGFDTQLQLGDSRRPVKRLEEKANLALPALLRRALVCH